MSISKLLLESDRCSSNWQYHATMFGDNLSGVTVTFRNNSFRINRHCPSLFPKIQKLLQKFDGCYSLLRVHVLVCLCNYVKLALQVFTIQFIPNFYNYRIKHASICCMFIVFNFHYLLEFSFLSLRTLILMPVTS